MQTNETDQWSSQSSPTPEVIDIDLRPGCVVVIPMASGGDLVIEVSKKKGRPRAKVHGATSERPVRTQRKSDATPKT